VSRPIDGVTKKRERFDRLPHGQAPCPRCDGNDGCGFCDGSGIVGDASCWVEAHPEHRGEVAS
jgi:hypothetical protein